MQRLVCSSQTATCVERPISLISPGHLFTAEPLCAVLRKFAKTKTFKLPKFLGVSDDLIWIVVYRTVDLRPSSDSNGF